MSAQSITTSIPARSPGERRVGPPTASAHAIDRDHLLDRLHNLRTIVPVFAQELASTRRQAATLRVENRELRERVQQLQRVRPSRSRVTGRAL
jgi:hypothetical protein